MKVVAETERILLREFEPTDAAQVYPVFSDPEGTRFTLGIHSDVGQTLAWINAIRMGYQRRGFAPWAVVRKEDGAVLGYCGCGMLKLDGKEECEIGYRIVRSCWGRGFASEALRLCIEYFRSETQFSRMIALIQAENVASLRVAERTGMTYERDTFLEGVPMRLYKIEFLR